MLTNLSEPNRKAGAIALIVAVVFIAAATLFAFAPANIYARTAPAQSPPPAAPEGPALTTNTAEGVCDRTQQVQRKILVALDDVNDCARVTQAHLRGITILYLNNAGITELRAGDFRGLGNLQYLLLYDNSLTALPADVFDGLDNLQYLWLFKNQLTALPKGVFSGLGNLQELYLSHNPGAPFVLNAELDQSDGDGVVVTVSEGAPFPITVTLSAQGGALSATTVVIAGGETNSAKVTTTPDGQGGVAVSVQSAALADNRYGAAGEQYNGVQAGRGAPLVLPYVCDRTEAVRSRIISALDAVTDCALVTAADLSGISALDLGSLGITEITVGDFRGLGNLQTLRLNNNSLTALPADVFDGLANLQALRLNNNSLTALPEDAFDGNGNLQELSLARNKLTALPTDVFDGLANLQALHLNNNSLTALPTDVFDGLANLQALHLNNNSLTALPTDVFDGLANLQALHLNNNSLTALPEDAFDGNGNLQELSLARNKLTALPADVFDGLSNLQELQLVRNSLATLPAGVFDGLGNLQALGLRNNPGSPFILNAELEQSDSDGVVVKVSEGAPFPMAVTLSVQGGDLSETTVVIAAGETTSSRVTATPDGREEVVVSVQSAAFDNSADHLLLNGVQAGRGAPLVLPRATQ